MANPNITDMRWAPFTIPAGNRDSLPIEAKGKGVAAILVIGSWTTSALGFTAQVQGEGATDDDYYEVYLDDGSKMGVESANMTAGRIIYLAPDGSGVGFKHGFKLHSTNTQVAGCRGYVLLRSF